MGGKGRRRHVFIGKDVNSEKEMNSVNDSIWFMWVRRGVLGETQTGSIPFRKLMKEIRLVGNPTITLIFILEIERSRYWEWWDWAICNAKMGWWRRKAQLSCSGALLPSSFGRVTDLCLKRGGKRRAVEWKAVIANWTIMRCTTHSDRVSSRAVDSNAYVLASFFHHHSLWILIAQNSPTN